MRGNRRRVTRLARPPAAEPRPRGSKYAAAVDGRQGSRRQDAEDGRGAFPPSGTVPLPVDAIAVTIRDRGSLRAAGDEAPRSPVQGEAPARMPAAWPVLPERRPVRPSASRPALPPYLLSMRSGRPRCSPARRDARNPPARGYPARQSVPSWPRPAAMRRRRERRAGAFRSGRVAWPSIRCWCRPCDWPFRRAHSRTSITDALECRATAPPFEDQKWSAKPGECDAITTRSAPSSSAASTRA